MSDLKYKSGQLPITFPIAFWLILLSSFWATNSVVIKLIVEDIPPYWAAFLRFAGSVPFLAIFVYFAKVDLRTNFKELKWIFLLACLSVLQIGLFNYGSQYTTGGRITLFIFSYPLMVPLLANFLLEDEKIKKATIIGSILAFIGIAIPLHHSFSDGSTTMKGDILEFSSALSLTFLIVITKKVICMIDKWRVIFWQMIIASIIFAIIAINSESFELRNVGLPALSSLIFQIVGISVFCFLSYQKILEKHNSSQVSVFFFITPLTGMLIGVFMLHESFEWSLLIGCLFVGAGIYIANKTRKIKENKE